jgi:hypothetical protein
MTVGPIDTVIGPTVGGTNVPALAPGAAATAATKLPTASAAARVLRLNMTVNWHRR